MLTNTYLPHVGGVARSVYRVAEALRENGHRVKVVAPEFPGESELEDADTFRVPAMQNFNGSDFSVSLPLPGLLDGMLEEFKPELLHAHHPFLLGDTAVRLASELDLPLVFTHHTMYERYTHYVGGHSTGLKKFAIQLSTEYANLCDHVIAPSESVARLIKRRGVKTPISAIPTGIDKHSFIVDASLDLRATLGIPAQAFLLGHIGRLAPEKNLNFLGKALAKYLAENGEAYALVVGSGPLERRLKRIFTLAKVMDRVKFMGVLQGQQLNQAYAAMDLFAFASRSETQGMVLAEAMAVGTPVIAVDAPGVREIVRDKTNGLLLPNQKMDAYLNALRFYGRQTAEVKKGYREAALKTAREFALDQTILQLMAVYQGLLKSHRKGSRVKSTLEPLLRRIQAEWKLLAAKASAAGSALVG